MTTAFDYLRAGLCVLPAILEEKRPALPGWKQHQRRPPTERQVSVWFAEERPLCVLTGAVSGNLELLDFDHGAELYDAWRSLVDAEAPGLLDRLVIERSRSGGRHVVYRSEAPIPGNQRLAQRTLVVDGAEPVAIDGKQHKPRKVGDHHEITLTLIETRGEGGLFLCAPTPGYVLEQGELTDVPMLTETERAELIDAARALDESPATLPPAPPPERIGDGTQPGDDFNRRGDVRELLVRHGWTLVRGGDNEHWRRPGKESGCSATLRDGVLYVFSSNATPFEPAQAYSPFAVYALLEHGGDFAVAAAALRALGYGDSGGEGEVVDLSGIVSACVAGEPPPQPTVADPGPVPPDLLRIPGLVSEVMDHCLDIAAYPNSVLAFLGALALQSYLAGRRVRDQADNRTNIYLLGLAYSSAGKETPRKVNARVLRATGLGNCLGDGLASGEGLQDALQRTPAMLFQTDEIDSLLQSINKSKDGRHEALMNTLLRMYSASNGEFSVRPRASRPHGDAIDQPSLTIFGTAVPTHYYEALSERMLTNGFFARTVVVESGPRGAGQEPRVLEVPRRVLEVAKWWADFRPGGGNLSEWHPVPAIVEYTDEAQRILIENRLACEAEYDLAERRGDAVGTTVWGRVNENSRKLALIHACSERHDAPRIGRDAALWGTRFAMHQASRMLFQAQGHVAANPFDADCLRLLERLRDAPDRTLPHSVLLKRMKVDARRFAEIILTLEQRGEVATSMLATGGRPHRSYRLRE